MNVINSLYPLSDETSSHYIRPNGLKMCPNFLNVVQTSRMGYKLSEWAKTSRTLNLLKIFWRPSCSESIQKNIGRSEDVVRTKWELVWYGTAFNCEDRWAIMCGVCKQQCKLKDWCVSKNDVKGLLICMYTGWKPNVYGLKSYRQCEFSSVLVRSVQMGMSACGTRSFRDIRASCCNGPGTSTINK